MADRIQLRRDSAANWTTANPVLSDGEIGLEQDTDQFKVGDGTTAWSSLPYGGIQGPQGDTGPEGPQGPKGDTGPAGADGATWHDGSDAPADTLGVDDDYYLDTTNGNVYQKVSGTWSVIANIEGPQGPQGDTGPAGADGATWHNGSGAPADTLGVDDDYYLDTTTGDVYQKAAGAWSIIANIEGPKGDPGEATITDQTTSTVYVIVSDNGVPYLEEQ